MKGMCVQIIQTKHDLRLLIFSGKRIMHLHVSDRKTMRNEQINIGRQQNNKQKQQQITKTRKFSNLRINI